MQTFTHILLYKDLVKTVKRDTFAIVALGPQPIFCESDSVADRGPDEAILTNLWTLIFCAFIRIARPNESMMITPRVKRVLLLKNPDENMRIFSDPMNTPRHPPLLLASILETGHPAGYKASRYGESRCCCKHWV